MATCMHAGATAATVYVEFLSHPDCTLPGTSPCRLVPEPSLAVFVTAYILHLPLMTR